MFDLIPSAYVGPVVLGAFTLLGVLVQRGRRETSDRFDRVERSLGDVVDGLRTIDKRQDAADVERAVLRNEVDTIKDRHAVVDMLHRRGMHRGARRGMLWLLAAALWQKL